MSWKFFLTLNSILLSSTTLSQLVLSSFNLFTKKNVFSPIGSMPLANMFLHFDILTWSQIFRFMKFIIIFNIKLNTCICPRITRLHFDCSVISFTMCYTIYQLYHLLHCIFFFFFCHWFTSPFAIPLFIQNTKLRFSLVILLVYQ